MAQEGSRNIADVTDTFGDLDAFRANGGKLLTFVGANDQLIMPQGVLHYYRQMARALRRGRTDDDFSACRSSIGCSARPASGTAPAAPGRSRRTCSTRWSTGWRTAWRQRRSRRRARTDGVVTRTRPLCPYPQTAIYKGSGSTDDAANFHCGGNLETREEVCDSVLVEVQARGEGPLNFKDSVKDHHVCFGGAHP